MTEPNSGSGPSNGHQNGTKKRAVRSSGLATREAGSTSNAPCGACKYLRRRCVNECIFAPYFSSDQGTAMFEMVHKVFGASNASKILVQLPEDLRKIAVDTLAFEARARISDPVYGCVKNVLNMQNQIASLQTKLMMVQNELMNRCMVTNTLQGSQQQQEPVHQSQPMLAAPPTIEHTINIVAFDASLQNFVGDYQNSAHSQQSFDPPQVSQPDGQNYDTNENADLFAFIHQML